MSNLEQWLGSLHRDAEFFMQLAPQRRYHRFIRLHLATRKFPQPSLMRVVGPAGDQYRPGRVGDDAHRHVDGWWCGAHVRYSALIRT